MVSKTWNIHIGTIFPDLFPGTLGISCINKTRKKYWDMFVYDLRKYAPKGRIDDTPFGGGGGMIMTCDTVDNWIKQENLTNYRKIYLSPRGKVFNQSMVNSITEADAVFLCGRYEGVDHRVLKHWGFEEVSIGDFILHGGELAAMVIIEACLRKFSVKNYNLFDSFSNQNLLEHNQYTKPREWKSGQNCYKVPKILLSGHHKNIEKWKLKNCISITRKNRPDLLAKYKKMNKISFIKAKGLK